MNIEKIRPGVSKRSSDGPISQFDFEADSKYVEWVSYEIRCGFRSPLYLYKEIFGDTVNHFVCSDDVIQYHAYRNLGIRWVPAIVLGRHSSMLDESEICLRINRDRPIFESTIEKPRIDGPTFLGTNDELKTKNALESLVALKMELNRTAACIKAFHIQQSSTPIHYHNCMYAIVSRLLEIIDAVELLLNNNLSYQIRPLVRSAYDLFLNFYIDWLAPEHGMLLRGLAI